VPLNCVRTNSWWPIWRSGSTRSNEGFEGIGQKLCAGHVVSDGVDCDLRRKAVFRARTEFARDHSEALGEAIQQA